MKIIIRTLCFLLLFGISSRWAFAIFPGTLETNTPKLVAPATTITDLNCQSFSLSPQPANSVYKGGETVTITATGGTNSNGMTAYWTNYKDPMLVTSWTVIPGSYNSNTHTFTATWVLPTQPQEIIVTMNNSGATGLCSGNPGTAALQCTQTGTYWQGNPIAPVACCGGCQKRIVIDPLRDLNSTTGIDTKNYFKIDPGNYWLYTGTNFTYPVGNQYRDFTSRIEIEAPTLTCGSRLISMRFLKDKVSGYILPAHYDPATGQPRPNAAWQGNLATRFLVSYFEPNQKWNQNYTGSMWAENYFLLPAPNSLRDLGEYSPYYGQTGKIFSTSGSQHFYFSPYLLGPRYYPQDLNWPFMRYDHTYNWGLDIDFRPEQVGDLCRFTTNEPYISDYSNRTHGWETEAGWETVATPVYSGQALRIKYLEYNVPTDGSPPGSGFLLREDWLLAQNLGLVALKQKNINELTDAQGNHLNRTTCGNECANTPMTNPQIQMSATRSFLGQKLVVTSPGWVRPGTPWTISVSNNYTGYLDISYSLVPADGSPPSSGVSATNWVENGTQTSTGAETQVIKPGIWTFKFRRQLPKLTDSQMPPDESIDPSFVNQIPWSDPVVVNFNDIQPSPLPSASPQYSIQTLRTAISDYLTTGTEYVIDGTVNQMDAAFVIAQITRPSPTPTPIPTATPTPSPIPTPTATPSPSPSPSIPDGITWGAWSAPLDLAALGFPVNPLTREVLKNPSNTWYDSITNGATYWNKTSSDYAHWSAWSSGNLLSAGYPVDNLDTRSFYQDFNCIWWESITKGTSSWYRTSTDCTWSSFSTWHFVDLTTAYPAGSTPLDARTVYKTDTQLIDVFTHGSTLWYKLYPHNGTPSGFTSMTLTQYGFPVGAQSGIDTLSMYVDPGGHWVQSITKGNSGWNRFSQ